MKYAGEVMSVAALLAMTAEELTGDASVNSSRHPDAGPVLRHTAADNALRAGELISAGETLDAGWRSGVLQTLDDYSSSVRRGGIELGAALFAEAPESTGSEELDAAFAALAEFLADRDGWIAPAWVRDPARRTSSWYPAVPSIFRDEAMRDSPAAFRDRGIFITQRSLARA